MDNLTAAQRQIRMNVRNFLLVATMPELQKELTISLNSKDTFRAACVRELIEEMSPTTPIPSDGYADGGEPYTDEEIAEMTEAKPQENMNITFYRYLSEDADTISENYPDRLFPEAAKLQLMAEIEEQDQELASRITLGRVHSRDEPYAIEATIDGVVSIERLQAIYENGVAGNFLINSTG
jgi:hypothetical protein